MRISQTLPSGFARIALPPKHQVGFSLIELMISITLGLIVLIAIGTIYTGSRQTYRVQEDNARLQEAGRYALEVIGRSIRQAGSAQEMPLTNLITTPSKCNVAGCVPINGTNGAAAAADTLAVQYYAQRDEFNGVGWVARDCTGGPVLLDAVVSNTFNVTGTSLQCTGNVGGTEALVEDVEDLQVVYGIDNTVPADQTADQYTAAPTAAEWPLVITARVCVRVRSANNGLVATPQRFLNCAGALGIPGPAFTTAADLRLHRSFVATYNLRNRINGAL